MEAAYSLTELLIGRGELAQLELGEVQSAPALRGIANANIADHRELTRELSGSLDPRLQMGNDNDFVCSPPIPA
jgi:hypothetical protein